MMEQNPFPEERKKRRRETSTGTPAGTKRNQQIIMEQNRTPFLRKESRKKKGDKHRNPSRNQEEPANHEGTKGVSSKN